MNLKSKKIHSLIFSFFTTFFVISCNVSSQNEPVIEHIAPSVTLTSTLIPTDTFTPIPPTTTPTTTPSPSATFSPTPSNTPTPTITPTPSPTAIGGGTGKILGSCEDTGNTIYFYNLETGEYSSANDFLKSEESWTSDWYQKISPNGDRVIWGGQECSNPNIVWKLGREMVYGCESKENFNHISDIEFEKKQFYPDLEAELVIWLPNDLGIFKERLENENNKNYRISLANIDGSDNQIIGSFNSVWLERSGLSPDGRFYVFPGQDVNPDGFLDGYIIIIDLETKEVLRIPTYMVGYISWSPDSEQFIYRGKIVDENKEFSWFGLFRFDMETRESILLGERWSGTWSPTGEWIGAYDHTQGQNQLFLVKPDGSDKTFLDVPEEYTRNRIHDILWLPDESGLYLKARLQVFPEKYALVFYNLQTGTSKSIFKFDDAAQYAWEKIKLSPDGEWIILETNYLHNRWGIWRDFYICNKEECIPFQPPDVFKCDRVDFVGP